MIKTAKINRTLLSLFALNFFVPALCLGAEETIRSDVLAVQIDSDFPRVLQYQYAPTGAILYGQQEKISLVTVNGENEKPQIKFSHTDDTATYEMRTHTFLVVLQLRVTANVLEFKVTQINDGGYHLLQTLEFPNHSLISLRSDQPGAHLTAAHVKPTTYTGEEFIPLADKDIDEGPVPRTYVILNTNQLAATIYNNVLQDSARFTYLTKDKGTYKTCGVSNGTWIYRRLEKEIVELPFCRVVIVPDQNNDGVVDWQDGAIAYRSVMDSPLGSDDVKNNVASQIAMNFASLAQHPFLRVLDNVKKIYLYTDGLGQTVQFKGYQSEGHDSAHPDYGDHFNQRAGGADDLNFVTTRMRDFHCRPGVHINATEFYPEAIHYNDETLTGKNGWAWLDESIYADKHYDLVAGNLYRRFDQLKDKIPSLSWIYVDVYFGQGWDAWKLVRKLHQCGWAVYTEFESVLERDAVWLHRSQEYSDLGVQGKVIRFIRNHQQDVWPKHPLLRGSYNLGFMGWHAENDILAFIHNVFTNNLPTKYLQHFKIIRWQDKRIDFEDHVFVADENSALNLYKDNQLRATGRYDEKRRRMTDNQLFIPWPPHEETKIYHWSDHGGSSSWPLPLSWSGTEKVKLYQLTDVGRTFVADLPVEDNKITIDAQPSLPYVIYCDEPAPYPDLQWGEGSLVQDPGFDSHSFKYWNKSSSADNTDHVFITNDEKGQTHLRIKGNHGADAVIYQNLTGLTPGQTYSASVWVRLEGKRTASLSVKDYGGPEQTVTIRKTDIPNLSYCADKFGTFYQRIKVVFDMPALNTQAALILKASCGAPDSAADFDDVRVVASPQRDYRGHYFFEDFEYTDEGWGPFVFAIDDDTHSHLSELHEEYTCDTINGRFSLKTRNEKPGTVFRSTPALLPLAPNTTYTLSFEYLADNDLQYSVALRSDNGKAAHEKINATLSKGRNRFQQTVITGDFDDYYLAIIKNDKNPGVLVIDDVALDLAPTKK